MGLDQDAVRYRHSWYRHVTLVMMAHAWLADQRRQERKKTPRTLPLSLPETRRLREMALPLPERSLRERWAWSLWRRAKGWQVQQGHYRHHRWPAYAGSPPLDSS